MIYTDVTTAAPAMHAALEHANRVLILSHVNPDGDAIGSLLGVWHALRALGKEPIALASSALPHYVQVLPGIEHVQVFAPDMPLPECDLIWMVDTASLQRVGPVYDAHADALAARPLVIVDHHVTNTGGGQVNLIDSTAASSAELVFALLRAMDVPVTPEAATCLLLGVTTDTQSFQTSNTRARTLRIAADLFDAGADNATVVQAVYFATPYSTVQMLGQSLSQIKRDDGLIWVSLTRAIQQQTSASDDAYDDVVGVAQRIDGMRILVLFKERADGTVKISLRSKPDIDVAQIARRWDGGGHAQAAGATLEMGLEAAQAAVLPVLRAALQQS